MPNKLVGVILGSDSDYDVMKETLAVLNYLGVGFEVEIASAHRTPERVRDFARDAAAKGLEVIIAGAGMAAHLPGFVAAHTELPVIAVPLPTGVLDGMDAVLSTVQMPAGVAVAVVSVGRAGAVNAAVLAAEIIALAHPEVREALGRYRRATADEVSDRSAKLKKRVKEEFELK